MRILDYQAALALYLAIIAQAHRDASGKGHCHYSERAAARVFLAELQEDAHDSHRQAKTIQGRAINGTL